MKRITSQTNLYLAIDHSLSLLVLTVGSRKFATDLNNLMLNDQE